jgi:hypothetical protein
MGYDCVLLAAGAGEAVEGGGMNEWRVAKMWTLMGRM